MSKKKKLKKIKKICKKMYRMPFGENYGYNIEKCWHKIARIMGIMK